MPLGALLGGIINAGANAALGAMGAGGASAAAGGISAVNLRKEIDNFAKMVKPIDFGKIVREPNTSYRKVRATDPIKAARDTAEYNIKEAIPSLIPAAQAITGATVDSVQAGMEDMFPGFQENVSRLSANIASRQRGELSMGAQRAIARNLASSAPLRSLGPESMQNAFAGFIGQSTEQLTMAGDSMMMQAVPTFRNIFRVTSADELMQFGGISTGQTLQARLQESARMQQALQFDISTRLEKDLNMASFTMNDRNFRYNFGLQAAGLMLQQATSAANAGLAANQQRHSMVSDALSGIAGGFGSSYQLGGGGRS